MRVQLEGESIDTFNTALYSLAEHCNFWELKEEFNRDRIVVGIITIPYRKPLPVPGKGRQ